MNQYPPHNRGGLEHERKKVQKTLTNVRLTKSTTKHYTCNLRNPSTRPRKRFGYHSDKSSKIDEANIPLSINMRTDWIPTNQL